jgi:HSP20 family molecular chaperone IbpA
MFKKRVCKKCGEKVSREYDFCPYCGNRLTEEKDWGMLGRNDSFDSINELKLPRGFNMLINGLMKNIDKQFRQLDKEMGEERKMSPRRGGISISISTSSNQPNGIKFNSIDNSPENKKKEEIRKKDKNSDFLRKDLKNFSKLPREEPSTNIRRLSDGLIYEIKIPGVNSVKDISINKLENSIEIKAVSKDKAYFKLIPINMPIKDYNLEKGKLILELEDK